MRTMLAIQFALLISLNPVELFAQTVTASSGKNFVTAENEEQSDPYMSKFFRVHERADLSVFTPNGAIDIVENESLQGIQVDLYVKREFSFWSGAKSLDNYRIIIQQKENQVIASVENKNRTTSSRNSDKTEFSFVIQVPKRGQLNLRSIHGGINVEGIQGQIFIQNHVGKISIINSEGEIKAASTTGNIELENLRGSIFAKSVSGNITANNNEGEIRVRSETGHIDAANMSGAMVAASVVGNIAASFREVSIGVSLETINGNIHVVLPSDLGYSVEASGMSYDFSDIQTVASRQEFDNRSNIFQVRGGSIPIKLSTITGRIRVSETE